MSDGEIFVVPFFGQGHLLPSMELCKQLASRNFKATLVITSDLSSSVPASLRHYPLVHIAELPSPPPPEPSSDPHQGRHNRHAHLASGLETLLSDQNPRPICAVIDVMMFWTSEVFKKFEVPTVGFFTSAGCSAAMEYAVWLARPEDVKPGDVRLLPGLPEEMALTVSDLRRRPHGPGRGGPPGSRGPPGPPMGFSPPPPGAPGPPKMGPTSPGDKPSWAVETEEAIALIINTCDDLERPFLEYLVNQIGKPVWGVGPLLPEQYWKSAGSLLRDREIRSNKKSSITEDEVIQWLDSKPRGSVLYVSFGSEVGPTMEEYPQLASALEESTHNFIWVIQPGSGRPGPPRPVQPGSEDEGYFPHGLASKVGKRGLMIRGWAPQLLILSHPSTGGFLSHCGWNSTVEAIGRGVPFLTWPIRGDQYYDAKLVVGHLKVGYMISDDMSEVMKKDDVVKGIEKVMGDEEMKKRAKALSSKFENGFPESSVASLDAFGRFICKTTSD